MQTYDIYHPRYGSWRYRQPRDGRTGKGRYIAAGVLAFIFIWPVIIPALIISWLIWGNRMFSEPLSRLTNRSERHEAQHESRQAGRDDRSNDRSNWRGWGWGPGCGRGPKHQRHDHHGYSARPSGNEAFDAYREDTLRRLQEEQEQFETFLTRLRQAKDKAEFDAFMDEQARRRAEAPSVDDETPKTSLDDDGPIDARK